MWRHGLGHERLLLPAGLVFEARFSRFLVSGFPDGSLKCCSEAGKE